MDLEEVIFRNASDIHNFDGLVLATTLLSALSCISLIVLVMLYPKLRKFPSSLGFWRAICDLTISMTFFYRPDPETGQCAAGVVDVTQTATWGSLNWYGFLAFCLFRAVQNPFRNPSVFIPYVHLWTWLTSIGLLTFLLNTSDRKFYVGFDMCWAQLSINGVNFIIRIALMIASVLILIYSAFRIRTEGMRLLFESKLGILVDLRIFLSFFSAHNLLVVLLWLYARNWTITLAWEPDYIDAWALRAFSVLVHLQGFVSAAAWLLTSRREIREVLCGSQSNNVLVLRSEDSVGSLAEIASDSDISPSLRFEFINVTSKGISLCAERSQVEFDRAKQAALSHNLSSKSASNFNLTSLEEMVQQTYDEKIILTSKEGRSEARHSFKEFAPDLFARLRSLYGVSKSKYLECMTGNDDQITTMQSTFTQGKPDSFHFFSLGKRFIVRTLAKHEHALLIQILPAYYQFIRTNPNTLISRYLGWYSVKMYGHTENIIVMENVNLPSDSTCGVNQRFDLKGSSINRSAVRLCRSLRNVMCRSVLTLTDLLLLVLQSRGAHVKKDSDLLHTVRLPVVLRQRLFDQMVQDTVFLFQQGLMDYSLLLGIHYCREELPAHNHCNAIKLLHNEHVASHSDDKTTTSPTRDLSFPIKELTGVVWEEMGSMPKHVSPRLLGSTLDSDNGDGENTRDPVDILSSAVPVDSAIHHPTLNQNVVIEVESGIQVLRAKRMPRFRRSRAPVIEGPGMYYMGIIDILTKWQVRQETEHWTKVLCLCMCRQRDKLSCVKPKLYANRFLFMMAQTLSIEVNSIDIERTEPVDGSYHPPKITSEGDAEGDSGTEQARTRSRSGSGSSHQTGSAPGVFHGSTRRGQFREPELLPESSPRSYSPGSGLRRGVFRGSARRNQYNFKEIQDQQSGNEGL